jgi:hypothetical protein
MNTDQRASLGFSDVLDDFDPKEFESKATNKKSTKKEATAAKKSAEELGFPSREAKVVSVEPSKPAARLQRRRRTGRDTQFNMKCKQETIDAYIAIADEKNWGLGETLEHAVELLQREFQGKNI